MKWNYRYVIVKLSLRKIAAKWTTLLTKVLPWNSMLLSLIWKCCSENVLYQLVFGDSYPSYTVTAYKRLRNILKACCYVRLSVELTGSRHACNPSYYYSGVVPWEIRVDVTPCCSKVTAPSLASSWPTGTTKLEATPAMGTVGRKSGVTHLN